VADNVISERLSRRKTRHLRERLIEFILFCAAGFSVAITLGIVYVLVSESVLFFRHVPIWDFLPTRSGRPVDDAHYGTMVLLSGTL
jgi:phosphate transport system permease protein